METQLIHQHVGKSKPNLLISVLNEVLPPHTKGSSEPNRWMNWIWSYLTTRMAQVQPGDVVKVQAPGKDDAQDWPAEPKQCTVKDATPGAYVLEACKAMQQSAGDKEDAASDGEVLEDDEAQGDEDGERKLKQACGGPCNVHEGSWTFEDGEGKTDSIYENLVDVSGGYFFYEGSQTTPPCADATWVVMRNTAKVNAAQVDKLRAMLAQNAAPVLPPVDILPAQPTGNGKNKAYSFNLNEGAFRRPLMPLNKDDEKKVLLVGAPPPAEAALACALVVLAWL